MDMSPPNAPAAVVRPADEDASAIVARLAGVQRWLLDQQAFLPTLPGSMEASARPAFEAELAAYWQAPVAPSPQQPSAPRVRAFTGKWTALMADVARLANADGELGERERDAILVVTAAQGHLVPPHLDLRELMVGGLAYAGAMIIVDNSDSTAALLFTTDRGWERFENLDALHADVERRLLETLAHATSLPGLADDDPVVTARVPVTSRSIAGNVFDVLVSNIVGVQRRKAIDAWTLHDGTSGWGTRLRDRLHDALAIEPYVDTGTLLQHRRLRLLASAESSRLAQLPPSLREQWEKALAEYRGVLTETGSTLALHRGQAIASIDQFARDRLGARLRGRGIADDPADITIELFSTTSSASHGYSGTDVERRPLVDLARENFGFLEMRGMQARTPSGGLLAVLGRDDIVDLIRELDLRNSYRAYLFDALRASPRGQRVRDASARLLAARMRFDLVDARSTAYIANETSDFIDDHAERGYQWVEAALDAPEAARRRRVENHEVIVSHIVYEGARLRDVLAISVRAQESVYRTVLYTPDAPDGRRFREFPDRQHAAAAVLNNPAFASYLADRLPMAWSVVDRDGSTRRFRVSGGTQRAVWALSGQSGERPYTLTQGRFSEEEVIGNVFDAMYDVALGHLAADAAELARSTSEADYDHARSLGALSARFAEGFLPLRLGLAVGSVRAMQGLLQGIEYASDGERNRAFENFAQAFAAIGDLMGTHAMARSLGGSILARTRGPLPRIVAQRVTLPDLDPTFDARYVARGIRLNGARTVRDGVYEIGGDHFVEHGGRPYAVQFDRDNDTWRLRKPAHTTADYAPPVVRDVTGQWRHRKDIGLRGGTGDRPDLYARDPVDVFMDYRSLNPETAGMTLSDAHVLVQALANQEISPASAKRLIYDRTHDRPTSAALMRRWNAALEEVRRPPPRLRTPPPPELPGYRLVKLERSQWPETVWHYTTAYRHAMFSGRALTLSQSLPSDTGPSGLHVMTLDPGRTSRELVEVMRGTRRTNTFTDKQVRTVAGAYVEIDLRKLRDRQRADGTYEFNLYTVTHRSGVEFVIKPTLPAPDPDLAPVSPRHQQDLAGIQLRPGEFRTGLRMP
jgi:hypothetical protein